MMEWGQYGLFLNWVSEYVFLHLIGYKCKRNCNKLVQIRRELFKSRPICLLKFMHGLYRILNREWVSWATLLNGAVALWPLAQR